MLTSYYHSVLIDIENSQTSRPDTIQHLIGGFTAYKLIA